MPESILKSMDGVMQFAMDGLGFKLDQIVIYAWFTLFDGK
jgi:hypothetical protein